MNQRAMATKIDSESKKTSKQLDVIWHALMNNPTVVKLSYKNLEAKGAGYVADALKMN